MLSRAFAILFVCSSLCVSSAFADDVIEGQIGPGALYRLIRPTVWNGNLVLYAHGTVLPDAPVVLPAEANLIAGLLTPQGFAVAFSSFSENGWAVKDGAQRTHQLLGIFTSKFGRPTRTYVAGASLGGLIAIDLVEKHPHMFAGALAACAPAGGAKRQFDYDANVRALFDFFYPNVLPGDAGNVDTNVNTFTAIVLPAIAAMTANPLGAGAIAAIAQTPVPFASVPELFESITTALVDHALAFRTLLDRTHGHAYFDNRSTLYTGAAHPAPLLQAINLGVERFDATPDALNYLEHYSNPDGDIRVPMLMLSMSRDAVAPGFHQVAYANAVASEGSGNFLVQRSINRYAHCDFTPQELGKAFGDLILWVEAGIKPAP